MGTSNNLANQVFTVMMVGLPFIYMLSWIDCAATVATTPSESQPVSGGSVTTLATSGGTQAPGAFYPGGAPESSLLGDDFGLVVLAGGAMFGVLLAGAFAIWSLRTPAEPAPKVVAKGSSAPTTDEFGAIGESDLSAWYGIFGSLVVVVIAMFGLSLILWR